MALSPEAAAAATFWQSFASSLRLLAAIAGLFVIPASHPCFAAAAAEFVLPAPEMELGDEVLLEPPKLELGDEVVLEPPALGLAVDVLLLLLPHPVTTALPATTSTNKTMTFALMCGPLVLKMS